MNAPRDEDDMRLLLEHIVSEWHVLLAGDSSANCSPAPRAVPDLS